MKFNELKVGDNIYQMYLHEKKKNAIVKLVKCVVMKVFYDANYNNNVTFNYSCDGMTRHINGKFDNNGEAYFAKFDTFMNKINCDKIRDSNYKTIYWYSSKEAVERDIELFKSKHQSELNDLENIKQNV